MKRWLLAVAALGFAGAAHAATLAVSSDKTSYVVGETITLTLTGTSTLGETTAGWFAAVGYSAALTETVSSSQVPHTTHFGRATHSQGPLHTRDGEADLLNQFCCLGRGTNGLGLSTATATLVAEAAGVVTVSFLDVSSLGGHLDYFDIRDPSQTTGTSFVIGAVPEPTAAALVALGLVGLAFASRLGRPS